MRQKKVWRYYCDFCKKAGCGKWAMEKHEQGCTMNPNRVCGMCRAAGLSQVPMAELLEIFPNYDRYIVGAGLQGTESEYPIGETFIAQVEEAFKILRKKVEDCPACILATFRQSNCPIGIPQGFDFKEWKERFWRDHTPECPVCGGRGTHYHGDE